MNKVLMISGSSFNSGKDTVGKLIADDYRLAGHKVKHMAFGDWVKDSLTRYYDWDGKKNAAGRYLLQHFATDEVRAADPDYWANVTCGLANATRTDWDVLIITDLRFPNEYEVAVKYFGHENVTAVLVERNVEDGDEARQHISENSLTNFEFNYIIDNNGTLEDLDNELYKFYQTLDFNPLN